MSQELAISVVIPVRDGAASIPALLDSLDAQTLPRDRFEVIVVDNASRDGSGEVARRHGATVVHEAVPNRSRARNRGAAAARADRLAFTDADCVADPGWLEALLGCDWSQPLVAGAVEVGTGDPPNAIERFEAMWRFGQESWVRQGWAATANLAVTLQAFRALDGFDPSWRHIGEDVDFCFRARAAGFGLGWCPEALVRHDAERTLRPLLKRSFLHGYAVNQVWYRFGVGYRAWRRPLPALVGDRALRLFDQSPDGFEAGEWRRMARLGRLSYAARVAGSAWAEARRAR